MSQRRDSRLAGKVIKSHPLQDRVCDHLGRGKVDLGEDTPGLGGNRNVRYDRHLGDTLVEGIFEQVQTYYTTVSGRISCSML